MVPTFYLNNYNLCYKFEILNEMVRYNLFCIAGITSIMLNILHVLVSSEVNLVNITRFGFIKNKQKTKQNYLQLIFKSEF